MRRSILAGFGMALALGLASSAAAETFAYRCTIKNSGERDWIQPLVFVAHNTAEGRVVVSDRVILTFNDGQPVDGRMVIDNAARITFAWAVDVSLRPTSVKMSYRATYLKSSGAVNISASAQGSGTTFTRGGTCSKEKLNS